MHNTEGMHRTVFLVLKLRFGACCARTQVVGMGWASRLGDLPGVAQLLDLFYKFVSKYRLSLGGTFDGVIAAQRMKMSQEGIDHCVDDEEACAAEW